MATAEEARAPQLDAKAILGSLAHLGINSLFHKPSEEGFLNPETASERELVAPRPGWMDVLHHYAGRGVDAIAGTRENAYAEQSDAVTYKEITGRVKTGKTCHEYLMRTPESGSDNDKVFFLLNGLTASREVYDELSIELARRGATVVSAQEVRGLYPNTDRRNYTAPEDIASDGAVAIMRDIREKYGDKRFILVGHSMGGATGVNAAAAMPEWVEDEIHLESTGVDDHNIVSMILRTKDSLTGEFAPALPKLIIENRMELGLQTFQRTALRPLRFAVEAVKAGRTDLRPRMEVLREDVPRIGWMAIHGKNSKFFPIDKVRRDSEGLYDSFEEHPHPEADHLFPLLHPALTAETILQAMKKLDEVRTASQALASEPIAA